MFMDTIMPALTEEKKEIKRKYLISLDGVDLSFANVREYERTKHVHRLHPYLGKFIPQLVELFLKHYFRKGDWILDPFRSARPSPPYVGLIDYHDQHKYAYELFDFINNGFKEIGPASKGRSQQAREEYRTDLIKVFQNVSKWLKPKAKIFVVVNDKDNLYPKIAEECNFTIEEIFHRPVLMRTERDNYQFSESIYYFRKR